MTRSSVLAATQDQLPLLQSMLAAHLAELGGPPDYPYLPRYWQEPGRFVFVIGDGAAEGFALVRRVPETGAHELAEFYVRPESRRRGLGARAMSELLSLFPGPWQLRVGRANVGGLRFWKAVLPRPLVELPGSDAGQLLLGFGSHPISG